MDEAKTLIALTGKDCRLLVLTTEFYRQWCEKVEKMLAEDENDNSVEAVLIARRQMKETADLQARLVASIRLIEEAVSHGRS